MKWFPKDKKYFTISLYALIVLLITILFEKMAGNFFSIWLFLQDVGNLIIRVLSPFLYGLLFAYLFNPAIKAFEKNFKKLVFFRKRIFLIRPLAIFVSYFIILGFLTVVVIFLVPEVIINLSTLFMSVRNLLSSFDESQLSSANDGLINSMLRTFNQTFSTDYTFDYIIKSMLEPLRQFTYTIPKIVQQLFLFIKNFAYALLDIVIGLFIAFYMLYEKDTFSVFITKIIYILFKESTGDKIINAAKNSNEVFEKFFIGKIIDSIIMGILFFFICTLLNVKYAILLSIIMGVTNVIPYFGPFIGALPIVLIVMMNDRILGLWMILIIFILQQFDGIILGPKILGDSTGIKPIGVIFAILVGGATFGVIGMFFGVPVFAVITSAISEFVDKKYFEKFKLSSKNSV